MPIYSTYYTDISGRLDLLTETGISTEVYSINAIRTNSGVRVFDLYVPADFDPTVDQRLIVMAPGQTGVARANVKDTIQFLMKDNSMTNVIVAGIYGKPETKYKYIEDIEDDISLETDGLYTGYTNIKELDISFARFSVGDSTHDLYSSMDIDFTRTVISLIRKSVSIKEIILIGESNGGVLLQMLASAKKDKINTVISNSGTPITSRGFGHSEPINILTLHGGSDTNVPYAGGTGIYGYNFMSGQLNFSDWVTVNSNSATLTMDEYGFSNSNNTPAGSVISEYIKDNGTVRNALLFVSAGSAGAGAHGLGDLATVDDVFPGTSRQVMNDYFFDFIERYPPLKW